jgi:maltose alpha-D-glucosyltransferase / alpha-amylase
MLHLKELRSIKMLIDSNHGIHRDPLIYVAGGTPVIRFGDEIGMGDDLSLPERNCARTPMQWSDEPRGGFTKSGKPFLPIISGGPYGFEHVNAATQRRHPESLLNWTERIIRMRKEVPEIRWGNFEIIPSRDSALLMMRYDWRNNSALFVHNFDSKPREISFATGLTGDDVEPGRLLNLLSEDHSRGDKEGRYRPIAGTTSAVSRLSASSRRDCLASKRCVSNQRVVA